MPPLLPFVGEALSPTGSESLDTLLAVPEDRLFQMCIRDSSTAVACKVLRELVLAISR